MRVFPRPRKPVAEFPRLYWPFRQTGPGAKDLYSADGYSLAKNRALSALRHAIEQGEKDQWFNALHAMAEASLNATSALQSIINKRSWR